MYSYAAAEIDFGVSEESLVEHAHESVMEIVVAQLTLELAGVGPQVVAGVETSAFVMVALVLLSNNESVNIIDFIRWVARLDFNDITTARGFIHSPLICHICK